MSSSNKYTCLQELKGNIRVFCRVRPLVGSDALTQTTAVDQLIQFPSSGVPLQLPQLMSLRQQLWLTDRCCHSTMRSNCYSTVLVLLSLCVAHHHCCNFQLVKLSSYDLSGFKHPAFELGFCCVHFLVVFGHVCWTARRQMPSCIAALQETCWGGPLPCRCQLTSPSRRLRSMTLPLTRFLLLQLVRSVNMP